MDPYEEYMSHLRNAERSSQKALDLLYKADGVSRPLWYRLVLGRAQNGLMTLLTREINWKKGKL